MGWLRIIALFAAGLGAAAQFGKISVLFSSWADAYPGVGSELGLMLSLISLMGAVLGLVAGMIVARTGFRRILLAALVLGAVLSGIEATLPPFPVILGLRALEGFSHLAIVVAAPTLMAELATDKSRPIAMTLWSTYFGMTFAIIAQIGPLLLNMGGLPTVLICHAGYMLVLAMILFFLLPDDRRTGTGKAPGITAILDQHVKAYGSPRIAAPGLGFFCYTLTFVAILTVIPPFLPESSRHALVTVLPVASLATSLTLGSLALRIFPAVRVAVAGFILAAVAALAMMAFPGTTLPPILLLCSLGFVQSGSFASIPQINANATDRALANGVVAQMGNFGNLLGTPVLLMLTHALGTNGIVVFAVVAYVAGATVHLVTAKRRTMLSGMPG